MPPPELVVCSHRGPYAWEHRRDGFHGERGGGGLIGAVAPVMQDSGGTWIAAAMSPGDHQLARAEPSGREVDGFRLRLLDLPTDAHDLHYDIVSNEYLWFLFHYLFDVPSRPVFDASFSRAWAGYREVNRAYAEAVAACGRPDAVFVEDYHLMLVGAELRRRRWRGPIGYFHHTPWCDPESFSMLPSTLAAELITSMLAYDGIGFHSRRWARAFTATCERIMPGAVVDEASVTWKGRTTTVSVAPVPLDVDRLRADADGERTRAWMQRLEGLSRGRRLLVRVDRIDLSKNPLRGYLAFEQLLERRPELARDVLFLALQYPSRLKVSKYRRYFAECMGVVQRVNERFGDHAPGDEGPIGLHFQDDFSRSLAALRMYDVLLVNPIYDGLNLVAKEGAALNERAGPIVLSRNAGVAEEIGAACVSVNPFDVGETADAIEGALQMSAAERDRRAKRVRRLSTASSPADWIASRLRAAGVNPPAP